MTPLGSAPWSGQLSVSRTAGQSLGARSASRARGQRPVGQPRGITHALAAAAPAHGAPSPRPGWGRLSQHTTRFTRISTQHTRPQTHPHRAPRPFHTRAASPRHTLLRRPGDTHAGTRHRSRADGEPKKTIGQTDEKAIHRLQKNSGRHKEPPGHRRWKMRLREPKANYHTQEPLLRVGFLSQERQIGAGQTKV